MTTLYPKRLIEVDLPIKEISVHARREKSIRHGHISTLHIWWARRPLAACRAVLCASLWPDPADEHCPQAFRDMAASALCGFAEKVRTEKEIAELCAAHWTRWKSTDASRLRASDPTAWQDMRHALLDFIADFANWDAANVPAFVDVAGAITHAAHLALGGASDPRPVVVDPFAGGGAIPLEALRLGTDCYASDLNPVAVLLNKVVLEYAQKYGDRLAEAIRSAGALVKAEVERELAKFYPSDPDGSIPVAYLWARTATCEGPGCGVRVPLVTSFWLSRKGGKRSAGLRLVLDRKKKTVQTEVVTGKNDPAFNESTVRRGAAICPLCGFTTPVASVKKQLKERRGGSADPFLLAVVTVRAAQPGRFYRVPVDADMRAVRDAADELRRRSRESRDGLTLVPDERLDVRGIRHTWAMLYGLERWGDLFTPRQLLALTTFVGCVQRSRGRIATETGDERFADAVATCLGIGVDRVAERGSSLARWDNSSKMETIAGTFGRQALPMVWDFAEGAPLQKIAGDWESALEWVAQVISTSALRTSSVPHVAQASASSHPLPDDSVDAFVTDPPYYDAVPYAYLADFFYVWLKRALRPVHPALFRDDVVPKDVEIVVDRPHELSTSSKDIAFYERELAKAFSEARRVVRPTGIGVIVFASKTTASWEAILQAVVDAGWIITGSWPIDTEMGTRVAAQGQARLGSSVHLVCRPRETPSGALRQDDVGAWRSVLSELPVRIHEWMPRLADEGVVGADAIFACIGPALEIFSRYSYVEKASGEAVSLKEYLEQVWAAVAREALSMMFEGADASGLEEDARLTAMWLWTLGAGANGSAATANGDDTDGHAGEEDDDSNKGKATSGFVLEFDAARKIAQGLGAHLEKLTNVVEVKGDKARLLAVGERAKSLFSKSAEASADAPAKGKKTPSKKQLGLFAEVEAAEKEGLLGKHGVPKVGETTLDRIHQAMILFGAGRSEALKRFVVEEGVGTDGRFWKLAQSLSALYPSGSDEKRWVDGVLARKKGLGY